MRRPLPLILAVAGVLAILVAGILRFGVVPAQSQLPADTDESRTYTGTVDTMLNAEALATGDLGSLLLTDVPATFTRAVTVVDTADGNADVVELATITLADGSTLLETSTPYTVDRRTMEQVGDQTGLAIGWPIGTEARDYVGWSDDLAAPVDLVYQRTEDRAGIETFVFTSEAVGPIVDETVLGMMPATLPSALLPSLAEVLGLPDALASQLPALIEQLPADVPLAYSLDSMTTYWVDPTTGMVIDVDRTDRRLVSLDVEGIPSIALADVFSVSYVGEDASVAATVVDAKDAGADLRLFGTTLPIALLLIGLIGIAASVVMGRRQPVTIDVTDKPVTRQEPLPEDHQIGV